MQSRVVKPEILDDLAADDPDAIRSRRDLRLINTISGNFRWAERTLTRLGARQTVELGAGDATFASRYVRRYPESVYTALDLAPRPKSAPESLRWLQGDLFEQLPGLRGDAVYANLFLHHFEGPQLRKLGTLLGGFRYLICSEPARFQIFHAGGLLFRLAGINHVTRHDLHVSIDAGFRGSELPELLGLDSERWNITIGPTMLGMIRMVAENLDPEPIG